MTRSQLPCRYYNSPGGCNRREKCTFSHIPQIQNTDHGEIQGSQGPRSSSSTTRTSPTPRASSSTRAPPSSFSSPPRGVCNYYWNTGSCKREFDCRYEHSQRGQRVNFIQSPRLKVTSQAAEDTIAPYLTEKGLAKIRSGGTDGFFAQDDATSLSPTQAHNCLKRYLSDSFKFDSTSQIYSFLIPLSSANASNRLWVSSHHTYISMRLSKFL